MLQKIRMVHFSLRTVCTKHPQYLIARFSEIGKTLSQKFSSYLKKKDLGFSFHLQQTCRQRCSKRLEKSRFAAFGKICKHHQQMESSV